MNTYHVEFSYINSPKHTITIKEKSSGLALKKAIDELDPYLHWSLIGTKITYIGD